MTPCLHIIFGPPFIPCPLFVWGMQSKEILLKLGNAQDSKLIIVFIQVGALKYM
jgi:hypothetical protein